MAPRRQPRADEWPDSGFLGHLAPGTSHGRFTFGQLPLRQRPVVVAGPVHDGDLDVARGQ